MSCFAFPLMLGLLVMAGLPIVLHLLQRQKPKQVVFPAFRFLKQTQRVSQRRVRLNNLLLLVLRILLLALLCLTLAGPRFRRSTSPAVVLVIDTSMSMT